MIDDLLIHYNRELGALRRLSAEFARAHPKVAARLRLSADSVEDPHVSRLLDAALTRLRDCLTDGAAPPRKPSPRKRPAGTTSLPDAPAG